METRDLIVSYDQNGLKLEKGKKEVIFSKFELKMKFCQILGEIFRVKWFFWGEKF